jgi:hypothetical protein
MQEPGEQPIDGPSSRTEMVVQVDGVLPADCPPQGGYPRGDITAWTDDEEERVTGRRNCEGGKFRRGKVLTLEPFETVGHRVSPPSRAS